MKTDVGERRFQEVLDGYGYLIRALNWLLSARGMIVTFHTSQAWHTFCWQHADQAQALARGRCSLAGVGKKHRQKAVIIPTPTRGDQNSNSFLSAVL